jgi:hypothetical protein
MAPGQAALARRGFFYLTPVQQCSLPLLRGVPHGLIVVGRMDWFKGKLKLESPYISIF